MGRAALGRFTVKSCGKAHAWCGECRPAQAAAQRRPKLPRKEYDRPCRNCGRCDACLGLHAVEGMKVCRQCQETKPVAAFARRLDTGGRRNQCMDCRNGAQSVAQCTRCRKTFARTNDKRALCSTCRPALTKPCAACGKEFVGSMDQRRYCSVACRESRLAVQRKVSRDELRLQVLRAYSGETPSCVCCGETLLHFLALDHIDGGGRRQRKELGGGGYWTWLKNNNYPPGFRVLCHNCNLGRQFNGGVCPHDTLVRELIGS